MPRGTISVLETGAASRLSHFFTRSRTQGPTMLKRRSFSAIAFKRRRSEIHQTLTNRSRSGLALPMVLGAITLIGTLIAGVMYLATQDYRVGANTLNETRAEAAAEMGLNRVLTDWDLSKNPSMATGDTVTKSYTDPNGATVNALIT